MMSLHSRCPELAVAETRALHVLQDTPDLPADEYAFMEFYCEEPDCHCHRVLFEVMARSKPDRPQAIIVLGWEKTGYYLPRLGGDIRAAREITEGALDPLNYQSRLAPALLGLFRDALASNPEYVARLIRHNEAFQRAGAVQPRMEGDPMPADDQPAQTEKAPVIIPVFTNTADILRQLEWISARADFAPYEAALRAAAEQREAITPELIAVVEQAAADPEACMAKEDYALHEFAILLLAQFRERAALAALVRFFSLPDELADELTADLVTEKGEILLASVCGGDPAPLMKLALDESVNEFVRSAAMQGLLAQHVWGERSRAAVVASLHELFQSLGRPGDASVWGFWVCAACDFHPAELAPDIRQAFAENLVDETVVDLDWFEGCLEESLEECLAELRERLRPMDAITEAADWYCFRAGNEEEDWLEDGAGEEPEAWDSPYPPPVFINDVPPYVTPTPLVNPLKPGRNDPCPCGSGKKYKKCCGK